MSFLIDHPGLVASIIDWVFMLIGAAMMAVALTFCAHRIAALTAMTIVQVLRDDREAASKKDSNQQDVR